MRNVLTVFGLLLLAGCGMDNATVEHYTPPAPPTKTIAAKEKVVENRVSAWDTLTKDGVTTKSQDVFYVIADDGTVCEVGLTDFYQAKVGAQKSCDWQIKGKE